jgi:hypothetical protein
LIPKFASEAAASVCELRNRDTSVQLFVTVLGLARGTPAVFTKT